MMRLLLFVMFAFAFGDTRGMEDSRLDFGRRKIAAAVQHVDDEEVKAIADQFVKESGINSNSSESVIVSAINETNNLIFWRTHGRLGDFRVYSKRLAELLLEFVRNKRGMHDFIVVINGILSGRVPPNEKVSYSKLVKSGVSRSLLSKIDIWQ